MLINICLLYIFIVPAFIMSAYGLSLLRGSPISPPPSPPRHNTDPPNFKVSSTPTYKIGSSIFEKDANIGQIEQLKYGVELIWSSEVQYSNPKLILKKNEDGYQQRFGKWSFTFSIDYPWNSDGKNPVLALYFVDDTKKTNTGPHTDEIDAMEYGRWWMPGISVNCWSQDCLLGVGSGKDLSGHAITTKQFQPRHSNPGMFTISLNCFPTDTGEYNSSPNCHHVNENDNSYYKCDFRQDSATKVKNGYTPIISVWANHETSNSNYHVNVTEYKFTNEYASNEYENSGRRCSVTWKSGGQQEWFKIYDNYEEDWNDDRGDNTFGKQCDIKQDLEGLTTISHCYNDTKGEFVYILRSESRTKIVERSPSGICTNFVNCLISEQQDTGLSNCKDLAKPISKGDYEGHVCAFNDKPCMYGYFEYVEHNVSNTYCCIPSSDTTAPISKGVQPGNGAMQHCLYWFNKTDETDH